MNSNVQKSNETPVTVRTVCSENWRGVARIQVNEAQREFVAEPSYYLALCCYGKLWQPLAVTLDGQVIGFLMWAIDDADGSCWLGGIMIDQAFQRQGYGRNAVQAAINMLSGEYGYRHFALSYSPNNESKHLYHQLGFEETNEWEDDEIVARLSLEK
jgi:diamine N-acetyltransferase